MRAGEHMRVHDIRAARRAARRAALPLVERHPVSDAWALNTYVACDIRCTYCITMAQGTSTPRVPRDDVAERLRGELDAITLDALVVGPYCDVYPGPEAELAVTRAALEVLAERDIGFMLITKGTTVLRDVDLLRHPRTLVQISLCSLDAAALARLEPGAPSPEERIDAVHQLAAAGVDVLVLATPWVPGLTDLEALRARLDPAIPMRTTPLRLPPQLDRARRVLEVDQEEVNRTYVTEYQRLRRLDGVLWSRPPPLDGSPPHLTDNLGRRRLSTFAPAPTAPDPGPPFPSV